MHWIALPIFRTNKAIESKRNIPTWFPKAKYHSCNGSHLDFSLHRSIPNPLPWVHESVGAPTGIGVIKMEMAQVLWSKRVKQQVSIILMRLLQLYMWNRNWFSISDRVLFPRALTLFPIYIALENFIWERSNFFREQSNLVQGHSDFFWRKPLWLLPGALRLFPRSFRLFSESTQTFSKFSSNE